MRFFVSLRTAGAVSAVLLCGCALAAPLVLTVSPAGRDSWSGKLAAPNAAKTDGPLASLAGAREAIRELKAAGPLTQPIQVRVRGGVYRPSEMLAFEPQDSGTEACPISYVAATGERPVLSGGVPVTGFRPWQGKIMVADVPAALRDVTFRSLFVDGERMIRARYPNYVPSDPYRKGFLYIRPSCFGEAIGAMHNPGDWLEWDMDVPAEGEYSVWLLYAHGMKMLNRDNMDGQTSLALDGGEKTPLMNLPDTGGWSVHKWSRSATLKLTAGKHVLRWSNDKGGGYNIDAIILTDDPAWQMSGWTMPPVAAGRHRVLIQAEQTKARHGLQIVECGGLSAASKTEFPFVPGQVKPAWANEPDAEVHVWPSSPTSCRAFNEIAKLERVDEARGVVVISGKEAAVDVCSGDRYFVENILAELDSPGEWYLDRAQGKVYLWPKAPLTTKTQVIAPRLTRLVSFTGTKEQPVQCLRLAGLALRETDYTPDDGFIMYGKSTDGVITLGYADHVAIEDCSLRNIGKAGIYMAYGSGNRVIGNEIAYGAEGGIYVNNSPAGTVISDNEIHHLGWVYKHVAGISGGDQVHGALISHNHVHDTTRWGISVGHTTSTNNIVEYNHIHDVNQESYDTGGLEVTQQSRDHLSGSIFRYNLIHDTGGYSSMMGRDMQNSWGIYLDSFAGGFSVYGNVVYGAWDGGLMVQGGKGNKVYNNIFVNNGPRRQILIANFSDNSRETEFHHNIVAYEEPDAMAIYCGRKVPPTITRWDSNLYWHGGEEVKLYAPGDEPYAEWFRPLDFWKGLGFDQESVIADPQFVSPQQHDYRLKPTSPALKLGFEPIDLSKVGPRR
ncbi:right-handed parallel beta-helix repeat-containing protein [bacterium]|nr:right-handed parallel beta-helix repeat-containing protein [bacterium]